MIKTSDIARNLQKLRGEIPGGPLLNMDGTPADVQPNPWPWIWGGNAASKPSRPDNWRDAQAKTPIKKILTGK